jgi:hypothetical protein
MEGKISTASASSHSVRSALQLSRFKPCESIAAYQSECVAGLEFWSAMLRNVIE